MTTKVARGPHAAVAQSIVQDLQAKLNDGHVDLREVEQLKRGWSQRPLTHEQAAEFRQLVLGSATRIQPAARKELQAFIETQLPKLTARPDQPTNAPLNVWEELQVKSLGHGRIDLPGTRELIASWSGRQLSADEAQTMTAQLVGMTGTFDSKEARREVQQFLQQQLPKLVRGNASMPQNFDVDLRLAAMDDGHLDAQDVRELVKRWSAAPLNQDQARHLADTVTRNAAFVDPGEARSLLKNFVDQQLPQLIRLQAPEAGPAPQGLREALEAKIQPDGHLDARELADVLAKYRNQVLTAPQAQALTQTILANAGNIQAAPRAELQRFLETQLPKQIALEPGQTLPRVPADDLRLKALGSGSINVASAEKLVAQWSRPPVSAADARAMVHAFLKQTPAFESKGALRVVQKFLLERLPSLTEGQTPRDLGFELKVAIADDGRLNATEAKQLVQSWSRLSLNDAQRLQLGQMVSWQLENIDSGEARQTIQGFVDAELKKRVVPETAPKAGAEQVTLAMQGNAAPATAPKDALPYSPNPEGTVGPVKSFAEGVRAGIRNDGHLDRAEVSALLKKWGKTPMTAAQASELRASVLGDAARIQPDARRALQRFLETELPGLTAADPNFPGPSIGQQLEIKALASGSIGLADARALIRQWSKGPLTAQQANEIANTVAYQSHRFASNTGLRAMQAFVQQQLPALVKDPQNMYRDFDGQIRVALLDNGRLDQTKVEQLIRGWESGPKFTQQQAHDLRSAIAQNLRYAEGAGAKRELQAFAERGLAELTLPSAGLDESTAAQPPKSLLEALGGPGADPYEMRGPRPSLSPERVDQALAQFREQPLTGAQAQALVQTVLVLGPSLEPQSRQALQTYLEKQMPGRVADGPPEPLDAYTELRLKALGTGNISDNQASELVRAWGARKFTAGEAQQLRQAVISNAGAFESNTAIALVQRFAQATLPKLVTDPANDAHPFADDLRMATLVDGRIDSAAANRLLDGWKKAGPMDAGRAQELAQAVLEHGAAVEGDPSAALLRRFLERDLGVGLDFTQQLRVAALESGKIDAAGARRLVETWGKQSFSPEQAHALGAAVLTNRNLLSAGPARETVQRFLEAELPKRTQPGADGQRVPTDPKQAVEIMTLNDGRIDENEARRLVARWNDPRTTPAQGEAIRQASRLHGFEPKAHAIVSRFVDDNLPRLVLNQALTAPNTVQLSWIPPFAYEDGSLLTDLLGYEIDFGTQPGRTDETVRVNDPAATSVEIPNRTPSTWYFRARTIAGPANDPPKQLTSRPSGEVHKVVK